MKEEYEKIGDISETRTMRVSMYGNGLYLYLPKAFVDLYDVMAGDMVKAKLMDIFRPKKDREN